MDALSQKAPDTRGIRGVCGDGYLVAWIFSISGSSSGFASMNLAYTGFIASWNGVLSEISLILTPEATTSSLAFSVSAAWRCTGIPE